MSESPKRASGAAYAAWAHRQGGYLFAAHPLGRPRFFPIYPVPDCPEPELSQCDGMELWSYMHDWMDGVRHWSLWR